MLKVGVVGIGNCGGQIAASVVETMSADAVALNTSDQDLEKVGSDKVKIISLGDKKGAGQNRKASKSALKEAVQNVFENKEFKAFVQTKEVIYIVSSAGGGTGSGIAPLMYHCVDQMTTAKMVLVGVLPTLGEERGIQVNMLNYLNEVYNVLSNPTYMLYDNNKLAGLPAPEMMRKINQSVAEDIKILSGFYNTSTQYASIDDADMLRLISPPGLITMAAAKEIAEKDLDNTTIEDMLVQDLKNNYHCEIDRDGVVENTGIIVNLSERINASFNANIPDIYKFIGEPKKTGFKHISVNADPGIPNNAFLIASGLGPINDRIRKANERIAEIDSKKKQQQSASALEESKLDDDEIVMKKPTLDIASAFEKFGV